jgi:hypothetical protein
MAGRSKGEKPSFGQNKQGFFTLNHGGLLGSLAIPQYMFDLLIARLETFSGTSGAGSSFITAWLC